MIDEDGLRSDEWMRNSLFVEVAKSWESLVQEQRNRGAVDDKMFTRESFCKAQTESIDSNKKNKYTNTQIQVQIQMQVHK